MGGYNHGIEKLALHICIHDLKINDNILLMVLWMYFHLF